MLAVTTSGTESLGGEEGLKIGSSKGPVNRGHDSDEVLPYAKPKNF